MQTLFFQYRILCPPSIYSKVYFSNLRNFSKKKILFLEGEEKGRGFFASYVFFCHYCCFLVFLFFLRRKGNCIGSLECDFLLQHLIKKGSIKQCRLAQVHFGRRQHLKEQNIHEGEFQTNKIRFRLHMQNFMKTKTRHTQRYNSNVNASSHFHCSDGPFLPSFACTPSATPLTVSATHELLLSFLLHEPSNYRKKSLVKQ